MPSHVNGRGLNPVCLPVALALHGATVPHLPHAAQLVTMIGMPRTISTTDAAKLTTPPTTRHTVKREIERGNLEAEKTAGQWIISEDEALRWAKTFKHHREQRDRHRT